MIIQNQSGDDDVIREVKHQKPIGQNRNERLPDSESAHQLDGQNKKDEQKIKGDRRKNRSLVGCFETHPERGGVHVEQQKRAEDDEDFHEKLDEFDHEEMLFGDGFKDQAVGEDDQARLEKDHGNQHHEHQKGTHPVPEAASFFYLQIDEIGHHVVGVDRFRSSPKEADRDNDGKTAQRELGKRGRQSFRKAFRKNVDHLRKQEGFKKSAREGDDLKPQSQDGD